MDAAPRAHSNRRPRPRGLAIGVWLAAVAMLAVMAIPMLRGQVFTYDDLGCFHLPVRAFYSQQLSRHQGFDWMPELFCGFYLTGEGQAGTYHPAHWLLYRFLPLEIAWPLEVLSSYPWMFVGAWLLLRRRVGRPEAAAFGAFGFTFCAFNLLHFVHPNAIAIVAHIPWLLWAIDVALCDPCGRRRGGAMLAIAVLTGSQLLLGYPQYVWFSLLAETAWVAMLVVPWPGRRAGCLGLVAAKMLGLLLGAAQVLPTVDALGQAARRAAGSDFANQGSLHSLNLLQLVSPYFFPERSVGITPHEAGLYLGAVPLALVVWLVTNADARRRVPGAGVLVWLGVASLLLALGPAGQLYRLQQFLPLVNSFRCPCRYLVLFQLVMMILAAAAFGQLVARCRRGQQSAWRDLRGLGLLAGVALAVVLAGFVLRGQPLVASRRWVLAGAGLVVSGVALVLLAARGRRWALGLLVLFTAADLGAYGLSYAVFRDAEPLSCYTARALVPPGKPGPRMASDLLPFGAEGPRSGNQMTLAGWSRVDGYVGLEPARQLDYQQLAALRVAGVGWVRRSAPTEAIAGLTVHDRHWLAVPGPLPYARLVTSAVTSDRPGADLSKIPVESTVLVERPVDLASGPPGEARVVHRTAGRMEVEVRSPGRQLLVVAESFHRGWTSTVDGRPQTVLRVNGDFLGCVAGPGQSRVVFEFRPTSQKLGAILSATGMGLVLLAGVGLALRSQPRLV